VVSTTITGITPGTVTPTDGDLVPLKTHEPVDLDARLARRAVRGNLLACTDCAPLLRVMFAPGHNCPAVGRTERGRGGARKD